MTEARQFSDAEISTAWLFAHEANAAFDRMAQTTAKLGTLTAAQALGAEISNIDELREQLEEEYAGSVRDHQGALVSANHDDILARPDSPFIVEPPEPSLPMHTEAAPEPVLPPEHFTIPAEVLAAAGPVLRDIATFRRLLESVGVGASIVTRVWNTLNRLSVTQVVSTWGMYEEAVQNAAPRTHTCVTLSENSPNPQMRNVAWIF
jgi:hypothetical protein